MLSAQIPSQYMIGTSFFNIFKWADIKKKKGTPQKEENECTTNASYDNYLSALTIMCKCQVILNPNIWNILTLLAQLSK